LFFNSDELLKFGGVAAGAGLTAATGGAAAPAAPILGGIFNSIANKVGVTDEKEAIQDLQNQILYLQKNPKQDYTLYIVLGIIIIIVSILIYTTHE
jgi:hypothetical protein